MEMSGIELIDGNAGRTILTALILKLSQEVVLLQ